MAKLDLETLVTVPDDPPAAGPDRALDPPPPGPGCPAVAEGDVAVAEGDVAQPAETPITAHISAAAAIRPLLLFGSNRRTLGRRAWLAMVTDVALETGRAGRVSWGLVGS